MPTPISCSCVINVRKAAMSTKIGEEMDELPTWQKVALGVAGAWH